MITNIIDWYGLPSQQRQSQLYKFKKFAKNPNFESLPKKMYEYEIDPATIAEDTEWTQFRPLTIQIAFQLHQVLSTIIFLRHDCFYWHGISFLHIEKPQTTKIQPHDNRARCQTYRVNNMAADDHMAYQLASWS